MKDTKMKPKYAGWYCNQCNFVHYNASQNDVDEHLKTHNEPDTKIKPSKIIKKPSWWDEWRQIRDSGVDAPMSEFYDRVEALLFKQEEQHKAEIHRQIAMTSKWFRGLINKLKQQHREELEGCWEFKGKTSKDGYGYLSINGNVAWVHRLSYELFNGTKITPNLQIDHLCRNRRCFNPKHLEMVTRKENILRGEGATAKNAKKTHCIKGHLFDEKNTYMTANGRNCATCLREYTKAWRKKHPERAREQGKRYRLKNREKRNANRRHAYLMAKKRTTSNNNIAITNLLNSQKEEEK